MFRRFKEIKARRYAEKAEKLFLKAARLSEKAEIMLHLANGHHNELN